MDAEFAKIATGIADWLSIPYWVLVAFFLISVVAWMCWRARSVLPIVRRIWRLLAGTPYELDPDIKRALQSEASLESFRVETGIPCRTLQQAKCTIIWSKAKGESLRDIGRTRGNFNLQTFELNKDWHWGISVVVGIFVFACLLLLFPVIGLGVTDQAVLSFKKSGMSFTLSPQTAQRLALSEYLPLRRYSPLTNENCAKDRKELTSTTGFAQEDVSDLCQFFKTPEIATYVKNNVADQRKIAPWAFAYIFCFGWLAWLAFMADLATRDMSNRLKKHQTGKRKVHGESPHTVSC